MNTLRPPLPNGIRGFDQYGSGDYGASRDGGTRVHEGLDFKGGVGEAVVVPLACRLERIGYAYPGDLRYRSLWLRSLEDDRWKVKLLYVAPIDTVPGEEYEPGDPLGSLADITLRYPGITPHTHLEVWLFQLGQDRRIDPRPFFAEA